MHAHTHTDTNTFLWYTNCFPTNENSVLISLMCKLWPLKLPRQKFIWRKPESFNLSYLAFTRWDLLSVEFQHELRCLVGHIFGQSIPELPDHLTLLLQQKNQCVDNKIIFIRTDSGVLLAGSVFPWRRVAKHGCDEGVLGHPPPPPPYGNVLT